MRARVLIPLALALCAGCTSPEPVEPVDARPDPVERATPAPVAEAPADPEAPWSDDTEGMTATVVLVANEVSQGQPVLAAYAFSSDPDHPWFGEAPLARGRGQRLTRADMKGLFSRLEERGLFGLPWTDQTPGAATPTLEAGLYVWDGPERLQVLREELDDTARATLYACELELRGLSGHQGWSDPSDGRQGTLIYVTRIGTREDARPAALVFSSDPEDPYFQRPSTEQITVKRLQKDEFSGLLEELEGEGLTSLPWKEFDHAAQIGPERALYLFEGERTRRVVKDAIASDGALKAFSAIERRLIRITMSKQ
ncbi:MAG: hypothetical protein R3F62_00715 [Planctomycetota bacterium]